MLLTDEEQATIQALRGLEREMADLVQKTAEDRLFPLAEHRFSAWLSKTQQIVTELVGERGS